jgi:ribosome-associated toxin RatA of RatAB toxin-antitoxin module
MKYSAFAKRPILLGALVALTTLVSSEAIAIDPSAVEVKTSAVKGSDMPRITAKAVLSQPPEKVWAVISDCSKYKGRMPRVAAAKLVKKDGNKHTCEVTVEVPFPFSNLTAVTEAVHEESAGGMTRRWKLVKGDYKRNEGSWEIKPLEGGKKSEVTYSLHVEPNTALPASILEAAQKKAIPDLFVRLEKEAGKL